MTLLDHEDSILTFDAAALGDHSALLKVEEGDAESTFVLRPDSALALAAALEAWALDRIEEGGIF